MKHNHEHCAICRKQKPLFRMTPHTWQPGPMFGILYEPATYRCRVDCRTPLDARLVDMTMAVLNPHLSGGYVFDG